jgi:hypothetical protein
MGFAELVIGPVGGGTRWLDPPCETTKANTHFTVMLITVETIGGANGIC